MDNNDNVVGYIYSTMDYNVFKKLVGNREVIDSGVTNLMLSIRDRGWIRNPIVVNEKFEIIDGQRRCCALRQLNMPVEYVVSEGATIDDCIALNIKQKNWSTPDYVSSYAVRTFDGTDTLMFPDYVVLQDKMNEFHGILQNESIALMIGSNGGPKSQKAVIQSGKFKIEDPNDIDDRLQFLSRAMDIIGGERGTTVLWASALRFVYLSETIKNEVMLDKLSKYRTLLSTIVKEKRAVESLETVYNYNRRTDKVYFIPEWDNYKKR